MVSYRYFSTANQDPLLRVGLVGWWTGGGSGLSWEDHSGSGNHGTLEAGPTWTLGQDGKRNALSFDGTDDIVTIPVTLSNKITTNITLAAWVNTRDQSGQHQNIISEIYDAGADTNIQFKLGLGNDLQILQMCTGFYNAGWQEATDPNNVPYPGWFHAAGSYDGTVVRLYINGKEVSTLVSGTALPTGTSGWVIGRRHDTFSSGTSIYWNGDIDDVRVYNRALSAGEIATLANPSFRTIIPTRGPLGTAIAAANSPRFFIHW